MSATATEAFGEILAWLKEKAGTVRALEAAAEDALYNKNDKAQFRDFMIQKASLLASIKKEASTLLAACSEDVRLMLQPRLAAFSQAAENALALDSTFYMSALLYPDDHVAGQPNNLELLIAALENRNN